MWNNLILDVLSEAFEIQYIEKGILRCPNDVL